MDIEEIKEQAPESEPGKLIGTDWMCFHMPSDPEEFIAALAAVEAFERFKINEMTRYRDEGVDYFSPSVYLVCDGGFEFMIDPKWYILKDHPDKFPHTWGFEVYMDADRARSIAVGTERNLVEGFSIMIGGDLRTIFPKTIYLEDELKDVESQILLLIDDRWKGWDDLDELLKINFAGEGFYTRRWTNGNLESTFQSIKNSVAVIGFRSAASYMACAQKRLTVEISIDRWKNYLPKFELPYGAMLWSDGVLPTPTLVYRSFEARAKQARLKERIKRAISAG